jgi:hypothetical protein
MQAKAPWPQLIEARATVILFVAVVLSAAVIAEAYAENRADYACKQTEAPTRAAFLALHRSIVHALNWAENGSSNNVARLISSAHYSYARHACTVALDFFSVNVYGTSDQAERVANSALYIWDGVAKEEVTHCLVRKSVSDPPGCSLSDLEKRYMRD